MRNIPLEVWWNQILPKVDDETLFQLIKAKLINVESSIFWKKRITDRWADNVVQPPEPSMEAYLEIIDKWNKFIYHDENTKIEIFHVEEGSPCKTPYHFSLTRLTPNPFTQKSIVCGPSYICREWMKDNEVLEFNTMRDLLNWRIQPIQRYKNN
jgi:hypothetical protein